jgi:2-polyprenyl-3-methyl-5-hydroxy-6-metoxy-1,4-benzoquinol methylase
MSARRGPKRSLNDDLSAVQAANKEWWESTPMTYDWADGTQAPGLAWYAEQDRLSQAAHAHIATDDTPFDRLIPYGSLAGKEVLEIGPGAGFHAELMARAGASVTGIDLTAAAVRRSQERFGLQGLTGRFEQWDAEQDRPDFHQAFDFVWSWGVIHHSSHTARIVRNVAHWLTDDGSFSGMVYHRDSTTLAVALVRQWILQRKLFQYSVDEALWRNTDGFSARFYPADQWRDLLLGFFDDAEVGVSGIETDLPCPRILRRRVLPLVPEARKIVYLERFGSFVTFRAHRPLQS